MSNWKRHIVAQADEYELVCRKLNEKGENLRLISDFSLGRLIGEREPSEYLNKLNDSWILAGDPEKGRQIKDQGVFDFQYKGKVALVPPIDWRSAKGENNFGWQLHSLSFLQNLVKLHSETGDVEALELLKEIVRDWSDQNIKPEPPSLLSWNDHATAIRLGVIGHIYVYLLRSRTNDLEFLKLLLTLAARHQAVLLDDSFYSKGTNHGLDQAFQLYVSSVIFPLFPASADSKEISNARVKFEVEKSFGTDGVHVENSPQYHPVILSSVLQVNANISRLGGGSPIGQLEAFVPAALKFLAYVLRPDGCFPPIGDSEIAPVRNNLTWLKGFEGYEACEFAMSQGERGEDFKDWHAAFTDSGYAVLRGDPDEFSHSERPHIVFKCGFLSRYHRQDDDTSFVLNALGEDWLVDGGLYIHDHGVPAREYLRSSHAHSLMMPAGAVATRFPGDGTISRLLDVRVDNRDACVTGETQMFPGFRIRRKLSYTGGLSIEVEDQVDSEEAGTRLYWQFWQIPGIHSIDVNQSGFSVRSERTGSVMSVILESDNLISVGVASEITGSLGIYSRSYNKLEPVTVIRADYLGADHVFARSIIKITH